MEPLLRRTGSRYFERRSSGMGQSALPPPALNGFADAQIAFAARAWTMRAEEEYRSAAVFSELLAALVDFGAPLDLTCALSQVVIDELRHAAQCTHLAEKFHSPAPRARVALVRHRLAHGNGDRRQLSFSLLLIEGAIGETLSSALFNAGRHGTTEPCARTALAAILRDEARHARFFWEAAKILFAEITDRDGERIQEQLRQALGALELQQALPSLRRLEAGDRFDPPLESLGVLPPERRVETFYNTVERAVLPRLGQLGLDGKLAWRDRHRAP